MTINTGDLGGGSGGVFVKGVYTYQLIAAPSVGEDYINITLADGQVGKILRMATTSSSAISNPGIVCDGVDINQGRAIDAATIPSFARIGVGMRTTSTEGVWPSAEIMFTESFQIINDGNSSETLAIAYQIGELA